MARNSLGRQEAEPGTVWSLLTKRTGTGQQGTETGEGVAQPCTPNPWAFIGRLAAADVVERINLRAEPQPALLGLFLPSENSGLPSFVVVVVSIIVIIYQAFFCFVFCF